MNRLFLLKVMGRASNFSVALKLFVFVDVMNIVTNRNVKTSGSIYFTIKIFFVVLLWINEPPRYEKRKILLRI